MHELTLGEGRSANSRLILASPSLTVKMLSTPRYLKNTSMLNVCFKTRSDKKYFDLNIYSLITKVDKFLRISIEI